MVNFCEEYKKTAQRNCNIYTGWTLAYVISRAISISLGWHEASQDIFGAVGIYSFAWWGFSFVVIFPALVAYFKMRDAK